MQSGLRLPGISARPHLRSQRLGAALEKDAKLTSLGCGSPPIVRLGLEAATELGIGIALAACAERRPGAGSV